MQISICISIKDIFTKAGLTGGSETPLVIIPHIQTNSTRLLGLGNELITTKTARSMQYPMPCMSTKLKLLTVDIGYGICESKPATFLVTLAEKI